MRQKKKKQVAAFAHQRAQTPRMVFNVLNTPGKTKSKILRSAKQLRGKKRVVLLRE